MTTLLLTDTTVLINFALAGRISLLRELVDGRGAWTLTVASECAKSATREGLEALAEMPEIFGNPIVPTGSERIQAHVYRELIAGVDTARHKSLGEAEAFAIIRLRPIAAAFVTDDRGARTFGASLGIPCFSTVDLIQLAIRARRLTPEEAWAMVSVLRQHHRTVAPAPRDRGAFLSWVVG